MGDISLLAWRACAILKTVGVSRGFEAFPSDGALVAYPEVKGHFTRLYSHFKLI